MRKSIQTTPMTCRTRICRSSSCSHAPTASVVATRGQVAQATDDLEGSHRDRPVEDNLRGLSAQEEHGQEGLERRTHIRRDASTVAEKAMLPPTAVTRLCQPQSDRVLNAAKRVTASDNAPKEQTAVRDVKWECWINPMVSIHSDAIWSHTSQMDGSAWSNLERG